MSKALRRSGHFFTPYDIAEESTSDLNSSSFTSSRHLCDYSNATMTIKSSITHHSLSTYMCQTQMVAGIRCLMRVVVCLIQRLIQRLYVTEILMYSLQFSFTALDGYCNLSTFLRQLMHLSLTHYIYATISIVLSTCNQCLPQQSYPVRVSRTNCPNLRSTLLLFS